RSAGLRAGRHLPRPRGRQPLRGRRVVLPVERGREPGVDDHGQRAARRRPAQRSAALMLAFGRETTGDLAAAERREWLCTNGIGGVASGTVAGTLTRRYHGLLVAALEPPLGRTLLCTKVDETVEYESLALPLFNNH